METLQTKTLNDLLSLLEKQNLCIYPKDPQKFIKSSRDELYLQLYVAPKEGYSLPGMVTSIDIRTIGGISRLYSLWKGYEKEKPLTVEIIALRSLNNAQLLESSHEYLKGQIDRGNYSKLFMVCLLKQRDIVSTAEGKDTFLMLVGRFEYRGKDFIVIPSLKHSFRIVQVRKQKDGDPNFCADNLYRISATKIIALGDATSW